MYFVVYFLDVTNKIDFSNDWVDKSLPYISISQILGLLSEPFDRDGVAQKTFDKNHNDQESQYFNKTKDEIIAMWEAKGAESRRYGKLLDDYIGVVLEGTEYFPQDMLAYIHKGEAVIPKEFNDKSYFSGTDNEETNRLLYEVIDAINNIEINPYTTVKDVGNASVQYIKDKSRQLGRSVI